MDENQIIYDIYKIVEEIQISLDNRCYFSALTSALIIPDVCSDIEKKLLPYRYSNAKNGRKRYAKWCNVWLYIYLNSLQLSCDSVGSWGDILYKLRCSVLHDMKVDVCNKDYFFFDLQKFSFCINKNGSFAKSSISIEEEITSGDAINFFLSADKIKKDLEKKLNPYNKIKIKIDIYYLITAILSGAVQFAKHHNLTSEKFPQLTIETV